MMRYLPLTLAGVMQSYGSDKTVWPEYRGTELSPTRSAVIGLIACAMGLRQGEPAYEELDELELLCESKGNTIRMTDYQIVTPREPGKTNDEARFYSLNGAHNKTQLTMKKTYLVDSEFVVYVGSNDIDQLKEIHRRFLNPVWPLFLGRKCCPPSKPIVMPVEDVEEVLLFENGIDKGKVQECLDT